MSNIKRAANRVIALVDGAKLSSRVVIIANDARSVANRAFDLADDAKRGVKRSLAEDVKLVADRAGVLVDALADDAERELQVTDFHAGAQTALFVAELAVALDTLSAALYSPSKASLAPTSLRWPILVAIITCIVVVSASHADSFQEFIVGCAFLLVFPLIWLSPWIWQFCFDSRQ